MNTKATAATCRTPAAAFSRWCTLWNGCTVSVAQVSVDVGGRGDDGTDRPAMLQGMADAGYAARWGFAYDGEGLLNDHEKLWAHMAGGNTALCNLRVGHIVALLERREVNGRREYLAVDSVAESASEKVRDSVTEVLPGTEIVWPVRNRKGLTVGFTRSHAAFWVDALAPMDFTLIRRIDK